MKIFISLLFVIVTEVESQYITEDQQRYVTEFYGEQFQVDTTYPMEIDFNQYANVDFKAIPPPKDEDRVYPRKLWLAMIHSIPSHIDQMENTRNTWCDYRLQHRYGFKCIFIFVESTADEQDLWVDLVEMNQTYHDIYFIDLPDLHEHWYTLQQKNINAYIMAQKLFPGYHFYSRVDDEIMVTVDLLSDFLSAHLDNPTVIGQLHYHQSYKDPQHKYYDPLAQHLPRYFLFPSGYLSIFSRDIIHYIAQWKHYYTFAPSSLEDPGFGHWIYKYSLESNQKIDMLTPLNWGGHITSQYSDSIVYHRQDGKLNQVDLFQRRLEDGYMNIF